VVQYGGGGPVRQAGGGWVGAPGGGGGGLLRLFRVRHALFKAVVMQQWRWKSVLCRFLVVMCDFVQR
jgi:hypothetical protein